MQFINCIVLFLCAPRGEENNCCVVPLGRGAFARGIFYGVCAYYVQTKIIRNSMRRCKFIKKVITVCMCMVLASYITGCNVEDIDKEKIRDLEYEILEEEKIPEEVYEQVIDDMDEFCRKAYVCSDVLYIVVCYGAQPTEGYSIDVDYLYESSNAVLIETTLKGPSGMDKVEEEISYPYIVLKVENVDKTVVFN